MLGDAKLRGGRETNYTKLGKLGRTGCNKGSVSFRRHPWRSVDAPGLIGRKVADGRCETTRGKI